MARKKSKSTAEMGTVTVLVIVLLALIAGGSLVWLFATNNTTGTGTTTEAQGFKVTSNVQVTVQDALADNAALSGVPVKFYSGDGVLIEATVTDANGIAKTSTSSYTSDDSVKILVGNATDGSVLPALFVRTIPRSQVQAIPDYLILDSIQFTKTAEESQVSANFYRQGATVSTYSKATGNVFAGAVQFQISTADLAFRESVKSADLSNYDNFLVIKINGTGWEGVSYASTNFDSSYKSSSYALLLIDINDIEYDLDSNSAVVGTKDGFVSVSVSLDLTGMTAATTVTAIWVVGGTMGYVQQNGLLPSGSDLLFKKTAQLSLTL